MFKLHSPYQPTGTQPQAIAKLSELISGGNRHQTLLGVTGSGKTFVTANVIAKLNKPTLVIAHNKTLAAQLYQEYRDFFPENAVSYFVSYYDYYQPEAYIPQTDTYIEKETDINEMIDKLRLKATANLVSRRDVIVVASVSCIYNLGEPQEYLKRVLKLSLGQKITLRELSEKLVDLMYVRSQMELSRSNFRIRGDCLDIWPAYEDSVLRIEIVSDKIKSICWLDPISLFPDPKLITNNQQPTTVAIYPAKHYIADSKDMLPVFARIRNDLRLRAKQLEAGGRDLEAKRLVQKVEYDLAMIQELGYVNGIENYSRYFDHRNPGDPPFTLLDYFKQCDPNFLTVIDESHITLPQIKGMFKGDQSRKQTLIDFGFRLPAAMDNRPLQFDEFLGRVNQTIYTSATPGDWELAKSNEQKTKSNEQRTNSNRVVELLVRPTGLIDPEIEVRNAQNQVPDLVMEILKRKAKNERVLVTTLTKKTAEALAEYLSDENKLKTVIGSRSSDFGYQSSGYQFAGLKTDRLKTDKPETENRKLKTDNKSISDLPKVAYLHSDIKTLDRQDTLDKLRRGEVDVIVGINLLREGLDLPEVSLVAILDADQEGFLRSKTSLIQTMGRAARHIDGKVILYAYKITDSMSEAIDESERRRKVQIEYNLKHNIFPKGINKPVREKLVDRSQELVAEIDLPKGISNRYGVKKLDDLDLNSLSPQDKQSMIKHLRKQMLSAADKLNFEKAAEIRDKITEMKS
ncbi:excinuclease ABC subunit UvrB [Candidatus Collierbacteria bacterium]|nr:excinuclease ABC subunit UvrB [Candidatus Collierbacteria bacterium]